MKGLSFIILTFNKSHSTLKILLCGAYVLVGLLSLSSISMAQGPWTTKTGMHTARFGLSANVVNDKIYVIGGVKGLNQQALSTVEEYDPTTDIWIQKEDMPIGRWLLSTSMVNGIIYAIGGLPNSNIPSTDDVSTVEAYDPTTNTWTTKTSMPTKRWYLSTSAVGGKIYAIGGGKSDPITALSVVEEYDPATDSWTTKASMPTPRWGLATSVVNGKIYAIGGQKASEQACSTVEEYDPATDTWTKKADMSGKRTHFSSSVVNGIIYVIGGATAPGNSISSVEMYNPDMDTWTTITDMPTSRNCLATSTVNNRIYAIGGDLGGTIGLSNDVEEYDPHLDLMSLIDKIEVDKSYAKPGTDSVCITTKMSDPAGIKIMAHIEAHDQSPVDSIQLFDDGMHNDGKAGDSLYANVWQVILTEEQYYYVDLKVTRIDTDTVINQLNNVARFTTIGPVTLEGYPIASSDTVFDPGDRIDIKLTLKNNSLATTVPNIEAKLISLDTLMIVSAWSRTFGDLAPGESSTSEYYAVIISDDWSGNSQLPILVEISSNDYVYWKDTIVIPGITDIRTLDDPGAHPLKIYPNPTYDILNIEIKHTGNQRLEIEIYTVTGAISYHREYRNINDHFAEQIDLSNYAKGIYLVKVRQAHSVYVGKVIVR